MPKKDWVQRAVETGDWSAAEQKAGRDLRRVGAEIRARRECAKPEAIRRFEGLEADAPEPVDSSEDAVHEFLEDAYDEDADTLPSDQQEAALAGDEGDERSFFGDVYTDYCARGGNQRLEGFVLRHLRRVSVEDIDIGFVIEL